MILKDPRKNFSRVTMLLHSTHPEAKQWFCWVWLF